jgi:hypothetical protein
MPKTARPNTTPRRAASRSKQPETSFPATPITLLWKKYQNALTKKRRLNALERRNDRIEPICQKAYDDLADIFDAILKARPTCIIDRSIVAEIIIRRERDLGGPCTAEELRKFCREIQIAAGFVSPLEARL